MSFPKYETYELLRFILQIMFQECGRNISMTIEDLMRTVVQCYY